MTYTTSTLDTGDASLAAYAKLLGVTSAPLEVDYLRWLYADNPHGAAVGFDAFAGDEHAAHYATIPLEATLDGQRARGLLSLNTATHPTHQGKGLFTRLAEQTYAHAAERGYEFVVGVANANSTPGFTRKLGFQLVAPLDVRVGAGRCAVGDTAVAFSIAWSDEALRWRLARPRARYLAARNGASAAIHAHTHRLGILAYLATVPLALADSLPAARSPLRMWIGIDPHAKQRGVLVPLPDRFKPSPLNLIFRDLTARRRQLDRGDLRFTLLDFDAY